MGWFAGEHDAVIGDEPADIIGDALDRAYEECQQRFSMSAKDFLANVAFASGHIALDSGYGIRFVKDEERR